MDVAATIAPALGIFGTGLSQHARLITLASAQDGDLPESLMPECFTGREAVNELYAFDVDALSTSTDLDLHQFIGEELTITLLPEAERRPFRRGQWAAGAEGAGLQAELCQPNH
ncbi:hypothetical protein E7V67_012610 [[Empedobacter] haloabium]|uniref:Uncharacterized protein n=1 Tax=[Empedobacter] haloabium TaxID=592317 RepID=A0ABZ1UTA8_9BURK